MIAEALDLDVVSVALQMDDVLLSQLEQKYLETTEMKNHFRSKRIESEKVLAMYCDYLDGTISSDEHDRRIHEITREKAKLRLDF